MNSSAIAIIGLAGRFPGAHNVSQFWQNLRDGVESIRDCSDAELIAAGATDEELNNPAYVKRAAILDDVPFFDASFFGFSPRDASIMDPQHRHFLECAWEALEDAAHPPQSFHGSIGVFAGSGMNTYLIHNLLANQRMVESAGLFQLKQTGNDKDVLATRVSYQFDLRGPSINVQTACSTSLVAVHLACASLLHHECDMALAGGVTIEIPHGLGYIYREGEILSRDGRCRSFDATSSGTVFASGMGVVVLRRLEDALASGDNIRAVILGSAINNDGARKVGYLAPSVEGQAEVIEEALAFADVSADTISYVEAHGTGTVVGDPIEVRALTHAFARSAKRSGSCAIGSVKSNVGHLDAAAGVAGLIKTVLALEHAQIPPSLHFETLNPRIDLKGSPFFVNSKLAEWPLGMTPRRAGVTSLGIGGTNAHIVLEEAPPAPVKRAKKSFELLTVSAKTEAAADKALVNLLAYLQAHPETDLADAAFTSQAGRQAFAHRRALVVENSREAIAGLVPAEVKPTAKAIAGRKEPGAVFLFSGQGSQYINMGRELYQQEPVFREALDRCAQQLQPHIGIDLIAALYPQDEDKDAASQRLDQTWLTQPALFSIEYALAQWWMSLGIEPEAMVGHSIGEYVAACLACVFSLEDALAIVATRGRLIYSLPPGSMLAVPIAAEKLDPGSSLSLAAVNHPALCVVSGPEVEIAALEARLSSQSIACRRLHTSHAFHSAMMDPILGVFEESFRGITLHPPRRRYLSNVSGTWIKAEEATDPAYWARHIRHMVRFADCMAELLQQPDRIFVEAGPGNTLTSLTRAQGSASTKAYQTLPHPRETSSDLHCALQTLGQLWVAGKEIDWTKARAVDSARRISLPTYPFEHQRYWVEPDRRQRAAEETQPVPDTAPAEAGASVYRRAWKREELPEASQPTAGRTLIFRDPLGVGDQIAALLGSSGHKVILADPGTKFRRMGDQQYALRPGVREDYDALLRGATQSGSSIDGIFHLWSVTPVDRSAPLEETLERSFTSPLYLAQALTACNITHSRVLFVSNRMQQVADETVHDPARAVLLGPARVIPQELPEILCGTVDIDPEGGDAKATARQLVTEMSAVPRSAAIAYRSGGRFVETIERLNVEQAPVMQRLKRDGVYLITGGLGGVGLEVAEHLARTLHARLVLIGRSAIPGEETWQARVNDENVPADERRKIAKLIEIRAKAGGLLAVQADVTHAEDLRRVVQTARQRFGAIHGVFHAAGVLHDEPLLLKTAGIATQVLDPKVKGTLLLEHILREEPLDCFVLFSSISSFAPPPGQIDYAAANAFLDAFALSRKGRVTAIDWDAWRDVGMAAHTRSSHPLLGEKLLEDGSNIAYASELSIGKQWVLAEHRQKTGKALLPGTGYLEMAIAAFSGSALRGPVELSGVFFLAPLAVLESESNEVRIELRKAGNEEPRSGAFDFSIFGRGTTWVEHATGQIAPCPASSGELPDHTVIAARCNKREVVFDERQRTKQERFFDFGPRWHCLKRLRIGNGEALAELRLDERFKEDVAAFRIHPALLDMATGCALYANDWYESTNDLYLPFSYKRLRVFRSLPTELFSHIRTSPGNRAGAELQSFDLTIFDARGEIIAEIEGFAMRRIEDAEHITASEPRRKSAADVVRQPIDVVSRRGITSSEGTAILARILNASVPNLLLVTAKPPETARTVPADRQLSAAQTAGVDQSIEATLSQWFEELLGVERVSLDDDFFAMGGHSLIGVRLFAKIQNVYKVNLELAALFEARTVRALADRIRHESQPAPSARKQWSWLVPIQPKGSKVPLFLIHAIGGEVLFYEPLAKALGQDQPVYALQSILTDKERIRETSLEELASSYLSEIRSLLPGGPYRLGGLSFGGLVAYEMARQLHAQGKPPELLVMIDAMVPGSTHPIGGARQLELLFDNLRHEGLSYLVRKASVKRTYLRRRLLHRMSLALNVGYSVIHRQLPAAIRYPLIEEIHLQALERYTFKPYEGKVSLIRAIHRGFEGVISLSESDDPTLGWEGLARGGVEVFDVAADHSNLLLEPQATDVAEKFQQMITQLGKTAVEAPASR